MTAGYHPPYDIMFTNKTRGEVGVGTAPWGLVGHWSVGGEQLFSFSSLIFLGSYFSGHISLSLLSSFSLQFIIIIVLFSKLFLSQLTSFLIFTFLILSSVPLQGSERVALWCLVADWG